MLLIKVRGKRAKIELNSFDEVVQHSLHCTLGLASSSPILCSRCYLLAMLSASAPDVSSLMSRGSLLMLLIKRGGKRAKNELRCAISMNWSNLPPMYFRPGLPIAHPLFPVLSARDAICFCSRCQFVNVARFSFDAFDQSRRKPRKERTARFQ